MSYDLITFDLDGTLLDTAGEIAAAANGALEANGVAPRAEHEITRLIGGGTRELMLKLLAHCFLERPELAETLRPEAALAAFDAHYDRIVGSAAQPYRGCIEALEDLQAAGVKLACVTNKELRYARRLLQSTGLEGFFALTVGGDSLPEKKPHRSVLRAVAERLGAATSRMAHLGDSAIDVAAARNAGVAAWAVPYGYNAGVPIAEARPDRLFESLAEAAAHALACRVGVLA